MDGSFFLGAWELHYTKPTAQDICASAYDENVLLTIP